MLYSHSPFHPCMPLFLLSAVLARSAALQGGLMGGIGASTASLPGVLRRVVQELADFHQVRNTTINTTDPCADDKHTPGLHCPSFDMFSHILTTHHAFVFLCLQIRHYVELAELRRVVLQYAVVEMGVLLREEAYRAYATPDKVPRDSKFK